MSLLTNAEYLDLGRRIVPLLGSVLGGPSAKALRELARAYDPAAHEFRISATAALDQMVTALSEIDRLHFQE